MIWISTSLDRELAIKQYLCDLCFIFFISSSEILKLSSNTIVGFSSILLTYILPSVFFPKYENVSIDAGSSPDYGGSETNINPEQKLAAAVSSCFMMTFLALAAKMKWPVINYKDKAISYLGKNAEGRMYVNKIELNPAIIFEDNFNISDEEMKKMKERSHKYCFIANSLSKDVEIQIN